MCLSSSVLYGSGAGGDFVDVVWNVDAGLLIG